MVDVNDAPEFASTSTLTEFLNENQNISLNAAASDADGDTITHTLTGDDAALFNIDSNGKITFKNTPDHETPKDKNGDNVYNVTVNASDGTTTTTTTTRDVEITVNNVDESPTIAFSKSYGSNTEFKVNTDISNSQSNPSITTLENGNIVIMWDTNDNQTANTSRLAVKGQILTPDGTPIGSEFLVNSTFYGDQFIPSVVALEGGGFVVAWDDQASHLAAPVIPTYSIKFQIYSATGTTVGNEQLANTIDAGVFDPSVDAMVGDGFVISWSRVNDATSADTSGSSIKVQVFTANGTKVNGELLVNTDTYLQQEESSVEGLSDGGFVVTWYSENKLIGADPNSGGIRTDSSVHDSINAQIYNASGTPKGEEFIVNSLEGYQSIPEWCLPIMAVSSSRGQNRISKAGQMIALVFPRKYLMPMAPKLAVKSL